MSYRLLLIAVLLVAPAGCCHPCCPNACGPMQVGPVAHRCGPHGGVRGHLHHKFGHLHSLFQPPRPAEITAPQPRFHPVPARPVFEYPPAEYMPPGQPLQ